MLFLINFTTPSYGILYYVFQLNLKVKYQFINNNNFILIGYNYYIDLCENSSLVFTLWTPDRKPFGGCSMKLFDENGALKSGKQKLIFYFDRCGDSFIDSSTPGELYDRYAIIIILYF
jgi:hypothetical protein